VTEILRPFPSPLAGEGGPHSGSDEGSNQPFQFHPTDRGARPQDPSSVGFADTFSRKGRRTAQSRRRNPPMRFTKDHEWVEVDGDTAVVGITAYAAEQLGDVVFVETPTVGKTVKAGDNFAVVESVKAASDVYAPISGEVVEANGMLANSPETVNAAPEAAGWFAKVKLANPAEVEALMDRHAYEQYLQTL